MKKYKEEQEAEAEDTLLHIAYEIERYIDREVRNPVKVLEDIRFIADPSRREIIIPFRDDMVKHILEGRKSCTSRNKKYGREGSIFTIQGIKFKITDIADYPLSHVASNLYEKEGCKSPSEFIEIWKQIHPRKGYKPDQKVYVHFFEKMGESETEATKASSANDLQKYIDGIQLGSEIFNEINKIIPFGTLILAALGETPSPSNNCPSCYGIGTIRKRENHLITSESGTDYQAYECQKCHFIFFDLANTEEEKNSERKSKKTSHANTKSPRRTD